MRSCLSLRLRRPCSDWQPVLLGGETLLECEYLILSILQKLAVPPLSREEGELEQLKVLKEALKLQMWDSFERAIRP